jgi:molybdopterin-guanine dinucleotide biosynthesis protein A
MPSAVTGIILAGGKGVRFGEDKALAAMNGRPLLEIVFGRFKGLFAEILISANEPSRYDFPGIKVVKDILRHRGPLAGIYSCLKESSNELNFVSACDMPFIQPPLIDYMIQKAPGYDVVVPSFGEGRLEPLHALYRKS